jgi:hypothetical protein
MPDTDGSACSHSYSVLSVDRPALAVRNPQKYFPVRVKKKKMSLGQGVDGLSFTQAAYSSFANRETLSGTCYSYIKLIT